MITIRKRPAGTKKVKPSFIHGAANEKGLFTNEQITAQLLEDLRNVTESVLRETRKVRRLLEDEALERKSRTS